MQPTLHPSSRGRVLAVDDSPVMRELVTATLEAVSVEDFDAVVLDVEMPGIDGMEVARTLRGNPRTSSSMIAMHTGLDEAAVRTGFDEYDAFLAKPCDARLLGECVERLIRGHRRSDDAG